jgi:DNA-binding MarR family transcriptional regulator
MVASARLNPRDVHQSQSAMQDAARYMLRLRKAAKSCFGPPVLSEPAWSLMLALYTADAARKQLHIGSVAKRADVPRSTALRWLTKLQQSGFVMLEPEPSDKRAIRVRMTEDGAEAMQRSFTAARFLS